MGTTDWKWLYLQAIAAILICHLIPETASQNDAYEPKVVCYYTNWSVYRPGEAKFSPQNINPYLCTHLIYAFGGFTKDSALKPFDKYQDIEKGGYAKFTGLKTYNKQLKTLLAIGGWNEASSRFSPLVASPEKRHLFARNAIKFLRQNHFDGLDLDWEYPAFRDGGKPKDRANYAQFVQELREEFERESNKTGRPRLLLTMAVPAGEEYVEKGFDIPKLNQYLDWFNLLTYDYHSSQEPSVAHHAPLYPLDGNDEDDEYNFDAGLNIDSTIKFYLGKGADSRKLVLGLPTYGRSYTLFNPEATELGSPTDGPGAQGDATREEGYLAYYEICQGIKEDEDWTVVQPNPSAMGPYAYREDQWVGYDDERMASRKGEYAAVNKLGGIMFWSIDNDDFRGDCTGKPYPIIEAAKSSYYSALGFAGYEAKPKSGVKTLSSNKFRASGKESSISATKTDKVATLNARRNARKRLPGAVAQQEEVSEEIRFVAVGSRTTPVPPTTPRPGGSGFKCESEGFYPNPADCKMYYWCLDSGPSELGIVAHQFSCPGGLIFNTNTDSCDYTRNVVCKPTAATKATIAPAISTTTVKTSTYKVNPITIKSSNFRTTPRTTTTTTEIAAEEEYDEEVDEDGKEAEDPQVLKELVKLINKAGGIANLEKQLLVHKNGSVVYKDPDTQQISTTPSTISASLYDKILTRNQVRKEYQPIRSRQSFAALTAENIAVASTAAPSAVVAGSPKVTYSGYSFNSRAGPQNEGIEKLDEFQGFLKDKPKYTILSRNRSPSSGSVEEAGEDEDDLQVVPETTTAQRGIFQYQYVNLQRKPFAGSQTAQPEEDGETEVTSNIETTLRPFTAAAPRGFASRYSSINRQSFGTKPATVIDEERLIEENLTEEIPTTIPVGTTTASTTTTTTTTTTAAPVTRTPFSLLPTFRRKTSVSPDEDNEDVTNDEEDTTTPPYTDTTETNIPEQSLSTESPRPETEPSVNLIRFSITDAPPASNIQDQTEIPNEILDISPIQSTFRPLVPIDASTTTTSTESPPVFFSNAPQVPQEKPRKTLKLSKPTRGPFHPNAITPRGRAVTQAVDQDESHSETSFQTLEASQDQSYRIRSRGQSRFHTDAEPVNRDSRIFRSRSTTPSQEEAADSTVTDAPQQSTDEQEFEPRPRTRSRRPNRPTTRIISSDFSEDRETEVTRTFSRGRGFTSRGQSSTTPLEPDTTFAPEIPSPRNQPRRFESRFSSNGLSSTDSPIFNIKTVSTAATLEEADTTTSIPPIRITLNSALNFGYANRKQLRQQVFTIEGNQAQEKTAFPIGSIQEDSKVIRPAVNVRFGVNVIENPTGETETTKSDRFESDNLTTNPMLREGSDFTRTIASSTVTPQQRENYSTRRTTISIGLNQETVDDFSDTIIEGQTFIPLEEEEYSASTITSLSTDEDEETSVDQTTVTSGLTKEPVTVPSTPIPSRGRTRLNIRRKPTEVPKTYERAPEVESESDNNRVGFRSQRRRTTTEAPQAENEEGTNEGEVEVSSPANRFNTFRRRTTTESAQVAESENASEASPINRQRKRPNYATRVQPSVSENVTELTRGEQLKNLEESLTLRPTRTRYNTGRLRTTTEEAPISPDEETPVITVSSTFSPRSRSRFVSGRVRTTAAPVHINENDDQDIEEEQPKKKPTNRFQSRFRTTSTERNEENSVDEEDAQDPADEVSNSPLNSQPQRKPTNRFQSRFRTRTTERNPVDEDVDQDHAEEASNSPVTKESQRKPINRFQNRFRTTSTERNEENALEEEVDQDQAEEVSNSPVTKESQRKPFNKFQNRFRTTTTEKNEENALEEEVDQNQPEEVPSSPVNKYRPILKKFTTAKPLDLVTKATLVDDDQNDPEYQTRITNKYNILRSKYTSTTTSSVPIDEPEAVTLTDEEDEALRHQLQSIRNSYTTESSTSVTEIEEGITEEGVTLTDAEQQAVTESLAITTLNRFQSFRNRLSTESPPSSDVTEESDAVENEAPATRRTPLKPLRNRFTTASSTESPVSEGIEENEEAEPVVSSTASNRFRNFASRTRTSSTATTENPDLVQESESTPAGTRGSRRRVVKRPRQRTTEADSDATPSDDATSTTEGPSFRTSRRRLPYSRTSTEATTADKNVEEPVDPTEAPRARNIRPNLFSRNRIQIESQKVAPTEEDAANEDDLSNNDIAPQTKVRGTYRRKLIRKRPDQDTEDRPETPIAPEEETAEQPRRRKIVRRLRPKTTPSLDDQESATEPNGDVDVEAQPIDESTDTVQPTSRTTLRRGKTQQSLAKTLEDLRKNRAQQAAAQPKPVQSEVEANEEEQSADEEQEGDIFTPRTTTRGRFSTRQRAPYSPKRPSSVQSTTEAFIRPAGPSARNRYSSRVKTGRKSTESSSPANNDEEPTVDEAEDDSLSVSLRPLSFRTRAPGSRFRNTYKGTTERTGEVQAVLTPSPKRTNLFANRSRFKVETSQKEGNEVVFEQVTEHFDDEQYVDDNYEGVTSADGEQGTTPTSTTTKKVANVPINSLKKPIKRPPYATSLNRKPNVPSTLRQSNDPYAVKLNGTAKTDTSSGRKVNSPAGAATVESTTQNTEHSEDTATHTEDEEEESSTNETNAINLQEYYARGGNGTPTPGPLSSLLNRTFKPKKPASTTTNPTTLHHVFAIDENNKEDKSGDDSKNGTEGSAEEVSKKLRKLIEVNRIVEVNSKQQKAPRSDSSSSSELMVEKVPTLDRVGAISRLAVVKLKKEDREARSSKILTPDMIFGVETSTISLQGLFEKDRQAKELVVKMEKDENNNTINVVYARTITQQDYPEYVATSPLTTTTTSTTEAPVTSTTTKYNNVVRPLVPMLRPETIEDTPYVITIANLDQVILTKIGAASTNQPTTTEAGIDEGAVTTEGLVEEDQNATMVNSGN